MFEHKKLKQYTLDEYFVLEEQAIYKSEYENGRILEMSGGTPKHSSIGANMVFALKLALRNKGKTCQTYNSELKIHIEKANSIVYPDASVLCEAPNMFNNRKDTITNPMLIVEVLSPSTASYDRGEKFLKYQMLPSFKEYVLISADKILVQSFYREEKNLWRNAHAMDLKESIYLHSIDCTIALTDIYDLIHFDTP